MHKIILTAATLLITGEAAMAQATIEIASQWGSLTADLADNEATRALLQRLPVTLDMTDHLRQEKTGVLPTALPEAKRQVDFENGTLGLWGPSDLVIYYRNGSVPRPGIVILGHIQGDAAIFDRPGPVTVEIKRAD